MLLLRYMKIENPPGSGQMEEEVEKFEDNREIDIHAKQKEQFTNDLIEKALEGKPELKEADLDRIEEIKSQIKANASVTREIEEIVRHQPTGGEEGSWNMPTAKKPWFKRAAMAVAFTAASMFGASNTTKAETGNLNDSTKNKIEKISSTSKESREAVNSALRLEWNKYTKWVKAKGLKGDESLDHNGKGIELLKEYISETPGTILSLEVVDDIQREFVKYREFAIQQLRDQKAQLTYKDPATGKMMSRYVTADENLDFFMKDLSIVDKYPGSKTVSHDFPEAYLMTFENDKLIKTENQGFAKIKKDTKTANYNDVAKNK